MIYAFKCSSFLEIYPNLRANFDEADKYNFKLVFQITLNTPPLSPSRIVSANPNLISVPSSVQFLSAIMYIYQRS